MHSLEKRGGELWCALRKIEFFCLLLKSFNPISYAVFVLFLFEKQFFRSLREMISYLFGVGLVVKKETICRCKGVKKNKNKKKHSGI